jgi:SAM-dependent methyltransferase
LLGKRFAYGFGGGEVPLTTTAVEARVSFEEKIRKGLYVFEDVPCFCGSTNGVLLASRERLGLYYPLVACRNCGILRASPRMTAASYSQFYDSEYWPLQILVDHESDWYFGKKLEEGERIRDYVLDHWPSRNAPKIVFEVGCDTGMKLVPWKNLGCEVSGVDCNVRRIERGKELTGITSLHVGGMEQFIEKGQQADLVILSHVLEHFLGLDEALQNVRRILSPSGCVYVALPGTFWWIREKCCGDILVLLTIAHTYQFSLATLRYVLECEGFELVHGTEEIVSLFRMGDQFRGRDAVPEGEFQRVMTYLRGCELRYLPRRLLGRTAEWLGVKQSLRRLLRR